MSNPSSAELPPAASVISNETKSKCRIEGDVMYEVAPSGKETVKGASLTNLTELLTKEDTLLDWTFIEDFLITYRYFTSPADLLRRLRERYQYRSESEGNDDAEQKELMEKWKKPVQLRVINILKKWLEMHFYDFSEAEIMEQLSAFVNEDIRESNPAWADKLLLIMQMGPTSRTYSTDRAVSKDALPEAIAYILRRPQSELVSEERKIGSKKYRACFDGASMVAYLVAHLKGDPTPEEASEIGKTLLEKGLIVSLSKDTETFKASPDCAYSFVPQPNDLPSLWYPKASWLPPGNVNPASMTLLTVPKEAIEEVARQLSLLASDIFQKITPNECRSQAWNKIDSSQRSPHLKQLIDHFNRTSYWVAGQILQYEDVENRVSALKKALLLAEAFENLKNFHGMFGIVTGLNIAAIGRLKKTWAKLPQKYQELWKRLSNFTTPHGNYRPYREYMAKFAENSEPLPPSVPYSGILLGDLTHIEDGNEDRLENGMINFEKMRMIASIWRQIAMLQGERQRYCFKKVPLICGMFDNAMVLNDDQLYELSLATEPREGSFQSPAISEKKLKRLTLSRSRSGKRKPSLTLLSSEEQKKSASTPAPTDKCEQCNERPPKAKVTQEDGKVVWLCRVCTNLRTRKLAKEASFGSVKIFSPRRDSAGDSAAAEAAASTAAVTEDQEKDVSPEILKELNERIRRRNGGVEVRNRIKDDGVRVEDSFMGVQLVDWLVRDGAATDREEAVRLGNLLILAHYIHHYDDTAAFEDSAEFYQFLYEEEPLATISESVDSKEASTAEEEASAQQTRARSGSELRRALSRTTSQKSGIAEQRAALELRKSAAIEEEKATDQQPSDQKDPEAMTEQPVAEPSADEQQP